MTTEDVRLSRDIIKTAREYMREKEGCKCEIEGDSETMHVILCNDLPNISVTCLGCGYFFDAVSKKWEMCCEPLERYSRQQRTSDYNYIDEKERIII